METRAPQVDRANALTLPVACLAITLWSMSCGGAGSTEVVPAPTPGFSLSSTTLNFANQCMGSTSTPESVTLTNVGNAALTLSSVQVTDSNASDFSQTNTCGSSVAANDMCTIGVTFTPSLASTESASVTITDNAGGSPQTVGLLGTGAHDVILSWAASGTSGVLGYNVYRGTTSGGGEFGAAQFHAD